MKKQVENVKMGELLTEIVKVSQESKSLEDYENLGTNILNKFKQLPDCKCEDYRQIIKIMIPYLQPSALLIHDLGKVQLYEIFSVIEKEVKGA